MVDSIARSGGSFVHEGAERIESCAILLVVVNSDRGLF